MESNKKVSVKQMIKDLNLEIAYMPEDVDYDITSSDINRPGLQFAGYFDHFAFERLQVVGKSEYSYLEKMDSEIKKQRFEDIYKHEIPAVVVTRGLEPRPESIDMAKKYKRIVLKTNQPTTKFMSKASNYLSDLLAPTQTIHGVLIDVYGIGMLITGESGVGKSETALELIKRGHRLVADDAVEISKVEDNLLLAQAPEMLRYFMEIRGIGILDVKSLYGTGAVKGKKIIDLVIELENWSEGKYYDRLGIDQEFTNILDVDVEKLTIPVKPGRNLAMILEVAARNHRQKSMGYNAAKDFNERLMSRLIDR
ncbi:MAG: HPr(Ser) kinase/phosphatase [Peptostreptococcaceae bacterium]|nr:HPr(Ser) kinase/phosphatase [Peptostreptococcaceae bacterium]